MGLIYGKNPVIEAINSGMTINKIYAKATSKEIYEVIRLAKSKKIVVVESDRQKLDAMVDGKNSQGIVAQVTDYEYSTLDEILEYANTTNRSPFIVVLDKVEDPHNLGAIIRTCECLGVHGVVIQKRNSCQVTDTVEKVAAGACSYVKVARVTNITDTIRQLKDKSFWIYGLDMEGSTKIYKTKLDGSIAIVVGNEGSGISRLVKENCDHMIHIPMSGNINSLNASVSAAIAIYEINRQMDN